MSGLRIMSGLHVVKKKTRAGLTWYVYAYRGGPQILKKEGGAKPAITTDMLKEAFDLKREGAPAGTISWLAARYRNSAEFTESIGDETRRDYRKSLDRIEEKYGAANLKVFEDWRMRDLLIQWRDENWGQQHRTADKVIVMLGTLLGWAQTRGIVSKNIAHGIPLKHKADRSDLIWEDAHWAAWQGERDGKPICPPQLMDAFKLASMTGLRLGDLVRVGFEHVFPHAIIIVTKKRGGRAVIPMLPELREWIAAREHKEGTLLLNSRKQAWTTSGLGSVFQKSKPEGFDRTMHDLRGTYVTWLAVKGSTDEEIARTVGWTAKRIAEIRARYVDEARVVVELAKRLSA